ncbi:MAG: TMEM165/GDT1 family protein [bacterium]
MKVFFLVLGLILVAELGDKTQFLAIALACKFKWQPVFLGIIAAVLILMGLAVLLGSYLLALLPEFILKIVAGVIFLFFALYTLLERDQTKEEKVKYEISPFWTTFLAFFLSELGDKTQLMTMALSAEYRDPFLVWLSASLAMIIVDGIAVFLGNRLGKIIPVRVLNYIAAVLFFVFGVLTLISAFLPALSF